MGQLVFLWVSDPLSTLVAVSFLVGQ